MADTVGARIRAAREAKKLSQAQLAERVARTRVAVSAWERGEAIPRPEVVKRLAEVLDIPPEAMNPFYEATEGVELKHAGQAVIKRYTLAELPGLARGEQVGERFLIEKSSQIEPTADECIIFIEDDSMAEMMRVGDYVRFRTETKPKDGSVVVAWIEGESKGMIRNYRDRGGDAFDLWPDNPAYDTITSHPSNPSKKAHILGTVVFHLRRLNVD